MIRHIADGDHSLQQRGYTLEEIAGALSTEGVDITCPTLKNYLQRIRRAADGGWKEVPVQGGPATCPERPSAASDARRLATGSRPTLERCASSSQRSRASRARSPMRCPVRKRSGAASSSAGSDDVVAWCAGHILELAEPEDVCDPSTRLASRAPPHRAGRLAPPPLRRRSCSRTIRRFCRSASRVVHAGDPDREGQLLVDEVLEFLGYRGPVDRLLISDLTLPAVRKALGELQPNAQVPAASTRRRSPASAPTGSSEST